MQFKKQLAYEIVKMIKGAAEAAKGQESFEKTVQHKELPEEISEYQVKGKEWKLVDLVAELELAPSKSEARRLMQGGGVKVDGEKVSDVNAMVKLDQPVVIQVGKRKVLRVKA